MSAGPSKVSPSPARLVRSSTFRQRSNPARSSALVIEAHVKRLPLRPSLAALLQRYSGRRGSAALRTALGAFEESPARTRNDFEERFFDFLDRYGFPRPLTNVDVETRIGTLNVDFLWPKERLIIELDGFGAHGTRPAFRDDRRRDRALRIAGWSPNRLVWEDLDDEQGLALEMRGLSGRRQLAAPDPVSQAM